MSADFIKAIPDGSKVYFRPVGVMGPAQGSDETTVLIAAMRLRCGGGVLYYRRGNQPVSSAYVSIDDIRRNMGVMPAGVRQQLERQVAMLAQTPTSMAALNGINLPLSKPLVMGVLNVTPDSFSDGGQHNETHAAIRRGRQMIAEGAAIIDVGGESTRPGATPVWEGDEAARVVPVIEGLADEGVLISIDTRRASVMEKAIAAGAHIINDVSALSFDPESLRVAAQSGLPVVLMHAQGDPETMQDNPDYDHVLLDVYDYLAGRIDVCEKAGIARDRIMIDPGIGFGKRVVSDNIRLMNGLSLFLTLGCPLVLGASRKRFIGAITGVDTARDRVIGSVAAAIKGVEQGAAIIRVHDVRETVEALKMMQSFRDSESMDGIPISR